MKNGRTLEQLAAELTRRANAARDFITDTRELTLLPDPSGTFALRLGAGGEAFGVTDHTHRQVGGRLDIPAKYYDRMRQEQPGLLAYNVNTWFRSKPERRMVRTLDGSARAFLSDRYRRLDNYELAEAVLPQLFDAGAEVQSCEVTDSKVYIKAVTPRVEGEVKTGDVVRAGIMVSNSEVGAGALVIQPLLYRLVCLNGMVRPVSEGMGLRRAHLGGSYEDADGYQELYSDEALEADDKAFWLKTRDIVRAVLSPRTLEAQLAPLREATTVTLADPVAAVQELGKRMPTLTLGEQGGILQHLIRDADFTHYGLVNAITRHAQDVESYDRSVGLEELGSTVLSLPKRDLSAILQARMGNDAQPVLVGA